MTKSGSDASHLISRHRRADATSADQHPTVRTAIEYRLSDGLCEIGIIDGIRAVGPHIHNPVAQFSQVVGQDTLQLESGMVRPIAMCISHFAFAICCLAAATTASGVKPNFFCNSLRGAEAPKVVIPTLASA
jgi:hypothetical protein